MTTNDHEAGKVSDERLDAIVDGFTGLEVCAASDRLDQVETLMIATELRTRRAEAAEGKLAEAADKACAAVEEAGALTYQEEIILVQQAIRKALTTPPTEQGGM